MVNTPAGLGRASSISGEGLFHWPQLRSFLLHLHMKAIILQITALPCGLSWQSLCFSDYLSAAIFSSQENYCVLEYSECFETLVLEALSNHHHNIYRDKLKHCPNWWLSFSLVSLVYSSHPSSLCLDQGWMKRTCLLDARMGALSAW